MSEHRTHWRVWKRRWPLLGLMLVLLMFGHDALMASEALAATQGSETSTHHKPVSPGHEHVLPAPHDPPPGTPHPEQCSVGFVALVRGANDGAALAHLPLPVAMVARVAAPASVRAHAAAWEEPHWPPGTLRALTQVFRI